MQAVAVKSKFDMEKLIAKVTNQIHIEKKDKTKQTRLVQLVLVAVSI